MSDAVTEIRKGKYMVLVPAIIGTCIGLVALAVVWAHLAGRSLPFVSDDRTAFILLAIIGMVMCAFGILTLVNSTGLLSPGMFVGAAIGILILIAFVLALMNRPMFLFSTYRIGFIALGVGMLIKWGIATVSLIYSLVSR